MCLQEGDIPLLIIITKQHNVENTKEA
jgi:hypothetical protein